MAADIYKYIRHNIFLIFGIFTLLLALIWFLFFIPAPDFEALVAQVLPEAREFELVNREPMVFAGVTDGELKGYGVLEKATGYQSDIYILTGVSLEGVIINTLVFEHQETPSFMARLIDSNFFDQFINREIRQGFALDKNIDGLSSVTLSAHGATEAIHQGVKFVGENYLGIDVPSMGRVIGFGGKEGTIIGLMALAVVFSFWKKPKIRVISLLISMVFLGFWYNGFMTYGAIGSLVSGSVPNVLDNIAWHLLVFGAFLLILLTGKNLFCFWICPFGAFQELLAKITGTSYRPSAKIARWAKFLPGFFAWFALMLGLITNNPTSASYEPFATLFSQIGTNLQWILLVLVLLASLFVLRFWCNYFCPVGYVLSLWVKIRAKGVRVWKDRGDGKTISS